MCAHDQTLSVSACNLWWSKMSPIWIQVMPNLKKNKIVPQPLLQYFFSLLCFCRTLAGLIAACLTESDSQFRPDLDKCNTSLEMMVLATIAPEWETFKRWWYSQISLYYTRINKEKFASCDICAILIDAERQV